jgi:hypothetical protein
MTGSLTAYGRRCHLVTGLTPGDTIQFRWRFTSDPGSEFAGFYLDDIAVSNIRLPNACTTRIPAPPLISVASRKMHGAIPVSTVGDLTLNLGSPVTVEPRAGGTTSGDHTLVFKFVNTVTAVGNVTAVATTSTATAPVTVASTSGIGTNIFTVNMTGVPNASHLTVTLQAVSDSQLNSGDIVQNMDVLYGDVNGGGTVTNADVSLVKAQVAAGGNVDTSNFKDDVNANGAITNADVSLVKTQVSAGAQLP